MGFRGSRMTYIETGILDPPSLALVVLLAILCLAAVVWWTHSDQRIWPP